MITDNDMMNNNTKKSYMSWMGLYTNFINGVC